MANDIIELIIEGMPESQGRVSLKTFTAQLKSLNSILNKLNKQANNGKQLSFFQVSGLSYNSPMRISLEAETIKSKPAIVNSILEQLEEIATAVKTGTNLINFDADILEDFYELAKPIGKSIRNTTLLFNGDVLEFTKDTSKIFEDALAIEDECEGGLSGMLEQINIHDGTNTFQIYPDVGPKKVICHFTSQIYEDAISAVGRRVDIFGTLKYRSGAHYAHQIFVNQIEAFPLEQDLPDWDDLLGRAPDATGLISSEAFIRELRDAW